MNINKTKNLLNELGIAPLKQLGQNFLINSSIAESIAGEVKKHKFPWVEVGPGLGSLTNYFSEEKDKIILVERDKKIAAYWKSKNFKVYEKDVLKMDLKEFSNLFTLFGNLPYQIVSSLIVEASTCNDRIENMIFMMQKELAERMLAKPKTKNYGFLSVISQIFWEIKLIQNVGVNNFYPVPKVSGSVLKFRSKEQSDLDAKKFIQFVKNCFQQRRKFLIKRIDLPKDELQNLFKLDFLHPKIRAEELNPEDFVKLYSKVQAT